MIPATLAVAPASAAPASPQQGRQPNDADSPLVSRDIVVSLCSFSPPSKSTDAEKRIWISSHSAILTSSKVMKHGEVRCVMFQMWILSVPILPQHTPSGNAPHTAEKRHGELSKTARKGSDLIYWRRGDTCRRLDVYCRFRFLMIYTVGRIDTGSVRW